MALRGLQLRLTSFAVVGLLALGACAAGPPSEPVPAPSYEQTTARPPGPVQPPAADPSEPTPELADPDPSNSIDATLGSDFLGPETGVDPDTGAALAAFRTWLTASRGPDPDLACSLMSGELVDEMLAEARFSGLPVSTCEELIDLTAELYRAFEHSAQAAVQVVEATPAEVTLFVTYINAANCGTVVLQKSGSGWIITGQSEECVGH